MEKTYANELRVGPKVQFKTLVRETLINIANGWTVCVF
jgi:hypothetical protein